MTHIFHILNGDCLAEQLRDTSIEGKVIICREALVSGPLQTDSLRDFWNIRAEFISKEYDIQSEIYYEKSVSEFEKIINIPEESEVNLWFEDDLFCQTNLWFCIFLLSVNKNLKIYRVFPKVSENQKHWNGFTISDHKNFNELLLSKVKFEEGDIDLAIKLWKAYQNNDINFLKYLLEENSNCFKFLKEVIHAYFETFPGNKSLTNPEFFIQSMLEYCNADFNTVFKEFQRNFGILGYGDLQVRKIYDKVLQEKP